MTDAAHHRTGNRLANWSVTSKIILAVGAMAVVSVIAASLGVHQMGRLNGALQDMRRSNIESALQQSRINDGLAQLWRSIFLVQLPPYREMSITAREAADKTVDDAVRAYREAAAGSADRLASLEKFTTALENFRALGRVVFWGEEPPAGLDVPAGPERAAVFQSYEKEMNTALAEFQTLERQATDAVVAHEQENYEQARTLVIVALIVGMLGSTAITVLISRGIRRQVVSASAALEAVAAGDLTRPAEVYGRDEIGSMAEAVNRARHGLRATVTDLSSGAQTLITSTHELVEITQRIGGSARAASSQAGTATDSASLVSTNVGTVAAGAEEMGASIREISQGAVEAAQVAATAVTVAESTNRTISKLGESSAEIGAVVSTITAIAEQTNLLALNATIEAARAGDAGKGFAVVASEVKDLAQETARATEDISQRVVTIQADTESAVAAIAEISQIISRINEYQLTIASAVEEQSATTAEMSRGITDASTGATDIAGNIAAVADSANTTTLALADADAAVTRLDGLTGDLQTIIRRFTV